MCQRCVGFNDFRHQKIWNGKLSSALRSTPSSRRGARRSPARPRNTAPRRIRRRARWISRCPGVLPVFNQAAARMAVKLGLAIGARVKPSLGVRAQELLLSGPAQGLPDIAVRVAGGGQGHAHHRGGRGREGHRHHARTLGRRRRQVAARGLPRHDRHRPQPRRHAAAGNRLRARPALGEGGRGLSEEAARARALSRNLRRQHAGRLVPLRRQRVGTPEGREETRYPRRDQERQFVPLRREGHRVRNRAPDRTDRRRRHGGAGNAPVRLGQGPDALDAQQGRGDGLPLLPRPRTCRRWC